jgi:hypothetical protein
MKGRRGSQAQESWWTRRSRNDAYAEIEHYGIPGKLGGQYQGGVGSLVSWTKAPDMLVLWRAFCYTWSAMWCEYSAELTHRRRERERSTSSRPRNVFYSSDPITHEEADTYLCKILRWSFFVRYLLFGHYVPSSRIAIRCKNVGVLRVGGQKPKIVIQFVSNMNTQATLTRKIM